jgi:hypothetical protein
VASDLHGHIHDDVETLANGVVTHVQAHGRRL